MKNADFKKRSLSSWIHDGDGEGAALSTPVLHSKHRVQARRGSQTSLLMRPSVDFQLATVVFSTWDGHHSTHSRTRENSSTRTSTIFYRYEPISRYAMAGRARCRCRLWFTAAARSRRRRGLSGWRRAQSVLSVWAQSTPPDTESPVGRWACIADCVVCLRGEYNKGMWLGDLCDGCDLDFVENKTSPLFTYFDILTTF